MKNLFTLSLCFVFFFFIGLTRSYSQVEALPPYPSNGFYDFQYSEFLIFVTPQNPTDRLEKGNVNKNGIDLKSIPETDRSPLLDNYNNYVDHMIPALVSESGKFAFTLKSRVVFIDRLSIGNVTSTNLASLRFLGGDENIVEPILQTGNSGDDLLGENAIYESRALPEIDDVLDNRGITLTLGNDDNYSIDIVNLLEGEKCPDYELKFKFNGSLALVLHTFGPLLYDNYECASTVAPQIDINVWETPENPNAAYTRVTNFGNMIIEDTGGCTIWDLNGDTSIENFSDDETNPMAYFSGLSEFLSTFPDDKEAEALSPGFVMNKDRVLKSINRDYALIMKEDGDLGLYDSNLNLIWDATSLNTNGVEYPNQLSISSRGEITFKNSCTGEVAFTQGILNTDLSSVKLIVHDGEILVTSGIHTLPIISLNSPSNLIKKTNNFFPISPVAPYPSNQLVYNQEYRYDRGDFILSNGRKSIIRFLSNALAVITRNDAGTHSILFGASVPQGQSITGQEIAAAYGVTLSEQNPIAILNDSGELVIKGSVIPSTGGANNIGKKYIIGGGNTRPSNDNQEIADNFSFVPYLVTEDRKCMLVAENGSLKIIQEDGDVDYLTTPVSLQDNTENYLLFDNRGVLKMVSDEGDAYNTSRIDWYKSFELDDSPNKNYSLSIFSIFEETNYQDRGKLKCVAQIYASGDEYMQWNSESDLVETNLPYPINGPSRIEDNVDLNRYETPSGFKVNFLVSENESCFASASNGMLYVEDVLTGKIYFNSTDYNPSLRESELRVLTTDKMRLYDENSNLLWESNPRVTNDAIPSLDNDYLIMSDDCVLRLYGTNYTDGIDDDVLLWSSTESDTRQRTLGRKTLKLYSESEKDLIISNNKNSIVVSDDLKCQLRTDPDYGFVVEKYILGSPNEIVKQGTSTLGGAFQVIQLLKYANFGLIAYDSDLVENNSYSYSNRVLSTIPIIEVGLKDSGQNCEFEYVKANLAPPQDNSTLYIGEQLETNQKLTSNNGIFESVMQEDGNFCTYNKLEGCNLWCSNSAGINTSGLNFQGDQNIVIYDQNGNPKWASNTVGKGAVKLVMQDDGNLVAYDENGIAVWSTKTAVPVWDDPYADNELLVDENLLPGQYLISENKKYKLYFQGDGNVVLYAASDECKQRVLWETKTVNSGATRLLLQSDANFVLYGPDRAIWASDTDGEQAYKLVLQDDANIVIYRNDGSVVWASNSVDQTPPDNGATTIPDLIPQDPIEIDRNLLLELTSDLFDNPTNLPNFYVQNDNTLSDGMVSKDGRCKVIFDPTENGKGLAMFHHRDKLNSVFETGVDYFTWPHNQVPGFIQNYVAPSAGVGLRIYKLATATTQGGNIWIGNAQGGVVGTPSRLYVMSREEIGQLIDSGGIDTQLTMGQEVNVDELDILLNGDTPDNDGCIMFNYQNQSTPRVIWTEEMGGVAVEQPAIQIQARVSQVLDIYPNPPQGILNLVSNENFTSYQVVDLQSRVLLSSQFTETNQTQVDVTILKQGQYRAIIYKDGRQIDSKAFNID